MNIVQIFIRFFIAFIIVLTLSSGQRAEARYAAIVIDAESGDVLHSVNADTRNYPASLTKMMTLYMLFEALDQGAVKLHQQMIVSRNATRARPSKLGLRRGERITIQEAIEALIAKSANDIAVVVAEELGGSVKAFAKAMTSRARKLGMRRTTFRNPHGLPNRGHLSTARDMAVLSRLLIKNFPQYYNYFATKKFKFRGRSYKNHNKLLGHYTGADGIKTGYTNAAGFNLAASAEREGNRIIAVVFGGKTAKFRDRHVKKLLDKGFTKLSFEQGSRDDMAKESAEKESALEKTTRPKPNKITTKLTPIKTSASLAAIPFKNTAAGQTSETISEKEDRNINALLKSEASLPPFKDGWSEDFVQKVQLTNRPTDQAAELPSPVLAKPAAKAEKSTSIPPSGTGNPQNWIIQIGAYFKMAPAAKRANHAAEKLSALGKNYDVVITTGENNDRTVYRARLSGLNKKDAFAACRQLKKHKFDCIPMSPQMHGGKQL